MIHHLKIPGIIVAAVLGLSAAAASVASAQTGTLTSDGPVTLAATENAGTVNALTAFGLTATCPGSTETHHKLNQTPHSSIPSNSSKFTVTHHIKQANCRVTPGNFPATVDMNGCDQARTLGPRAVPPDTYFFMEHVICPPNAQITWTVFTNAAKETENKPFCILHIGPQENLTGGLTATDTTNGSISFSGTVEGIKVKKTNGGEDPLLCPAAEISTGKFDINVTATGKNEAGGATSVSLSG